MFEPGGIEQLKNDVAKNYQKKRQVEGEGEGQAGQKANDQGNDSGPFCEAARGEGAFALYGVAPVFLNIEKVVESIESAGDEAKAKEGLSGGEDGGGI